MIAEDNPLDKVWTTYKISNDCFKVADRARGRDDISLLQRTDFVSLEGNAAVEVMKSCYDELGDFAILSLWAVFERFLIDYLQEKGSDLKLVKPDILASRFYEKFESAVERWELADILDLFKDIVGPTLVGDAKNIKKHRDFVAHRNPKKLPPSRISPDLAYKLLSAFILRIREAG